MVKRKIIQINDALCNGCGACVPKCAEGALQIIDGKARIIKETNCDGLGACLGQCPTGALEIIEREAPSFSEAEVHEHLKNQAKTPKISDPAKPQWPVKLNLVPVKAPFWENADILVAADCLPIAVKDFHGTFLAAKRVVIGCPKFDDAREYATKLGEILKQNNIASVTVAHMEVPCCSGLKWAVDQALETAGKKIPTKEYEIKIGGEISELKR